MDRDVALSVGVMVLLMVITVVYIIVIALIGLALLLPLGAELGRRTADPARAI